MSFEVTAPAEGKVTIELDWREAEVLVRLLDLAHDGSLRYNAPTLAGVYDELHDKFGNNLQEDCANFYSKIRDYQVVIYDKVPF